MNDRQRAARERYRWSCGHPNYWMQNALMLEMTGAKEFAQASRNYADRLRERHD